MHLKRKQTKKTRMAIAKLFGLNAIAINFINIWLMILDLIMCLSFLILNHQLLVFYMDGQELGASFECVVFCYLQKYQQSSIFLLLKSLKNVNIQTKFSTIPCNFCKNRYRISSNKCPLRLLNFKTVSCGAYFKVRKMNNIKRQNLVIFSFKIRMKHKFSISINQM